MNIHRSHDAFYDTLSTPLGTVYLTYTTAPEGLRLAALDFKAPRPLSDKRPAKIPKGLYTQEEEGLEAVKGQLREYFEGRRREFDVPFVLLGTDFDKKVLLTLREVPYGQTRTYKWLAERVGSPGAGRAVGQTLSRNPLPVILPCHRIVQSDGRPGGYSSGVRLKMRLLALEYYNSL